MNLTRQETTFYESAYLNATQQSSSPDETTCRNLLKRGVSDSSTRDQIWNLISENSTKRAVAKDDFFQMLKYIAAVQQGYEIAQISIDKLPELALPSLPKKKKNKKNARTPAIEPVECVSTGEVQPFTAELTQKTDEEVSRDENLLTPPQEELERSKEQTAFNAEDEAFKIEEDSDKDMIATFSRSPAVMASENENQELAQRAVQSSGLNVPSSQTLEEFALDLELPPEYASKTSVETQRELKKPLLEDLCEKYHEASIIKSPQLANAMTDSGRRESTTQQRQSIRKSLSRHVNTSSNFEPLLPETLDEVVIPDFEEEVPSTSASSITNPFKESAALNKGLIPTFKYKEGDQVSEISTHQDTNKSADYEDVQDVSSFVRYNEFIEQNQKIRISIDRTVTYSSGFLGYGTYVAYIVKSRYLESNVCFEAERRYSDFDWLNSYLRNSSRYKGLVFPLLPEKKSIGNMEPVFVQQRKMELERYLKELARHSVLSKDPVLKGFLGEKSREEFQVMKDRNPFNGITLALPNLDWDKMKDMYEYALANVKVKLKKEALPSDWKEANENISEVLKVNGMVEKMFKTLHKKQESLRTQQAMTAHLNISHMRVMNRVDNEAYYAIGSLSSLFMAKTSHIDEEFAVIEDLIRDVRVLKTRLDCFKESYGLLISALQDIGTNKELYKNKQSKLFEYRAENNSQNMAIVSRELVEVEKKIAALEKEVIIIRDNLNLETKTVMEEFEVLLPYVLDEFHGKQKDHCRKVAESWKTISQQQTVDKLTPPI